MSFLFPKTGHKHVHSREPGIPVGKELQEITSQDQQAVEGDFGGSHVHEFRNRLHGSEGGEGHVPTSSLRQAAHRASEEKLHHGDASYLKTPNLVHKIPTHHHHHHDLKSGTNIAAAERDAAAKHIHSSHSKASSGRFQFSWRSPFNAMYRTAKRIYHFFASSTSSPSSSSPLKKAAATFSLFQRHPKKDDSFSQEKYRRNEKLSSNMEERIHQFIDDMEGGKKDFHPLNEEHHKSLKRHLRNEMPSEGLAMTLEEFQEQIKGRAENERKAMEEVSKGIYSNLKPPKKNKEEFISEN